MSFLNPYILWGLFAVSIPVIIHLFNFRKFRRIYFTNVRFLEELKQQTRRQSQLRHILVMILRMSAIAALVLAFAQPYIPAEHSRARLEKVNHISVYIDNSFSMEQISADGPLIDVAKTKAREIAASYRSSDLFSIVTNDFEGRHQRWVGQEEFLQSVDEVAISPNVRSISDVLRRQSDLTYSTDHAGVSAYLISDFQLGSFDVENFPDDSLVSKWFVPLSAERKDNLFIDSCWFDTPVHQMNQVVKLIVRIVNGSETDFEKVPLKLSVNGQQKAVASFDLPRGLSLDVELPFTNHTPGIQFGTLEITDFPVVFDDRFHFVYEVAGNIPVLAINEKEVSNYLEALFGNDSTFNFVNNPYSNIDYDRLIDYNLVILNELKEISSGLAQELKTYLENGGTILVIPSPEMDIGTYREFFGSLGINSYTEFAEESTRVSEIDTRNPVFSDVFERSGVKDLAKPDNTDWPFVSGYYKISGSSTTLQLGIMTMLNGQYFMTREQTGKGYVYLLAAPLEEEYSNFARHAIFVPALFRIALLSAATDPLYYTIGRDNTVEIFNSGISGDRTLKIRSSEDLSEFIPGHFSQNRSLNLQLNNQVKYAGHYELLASEVVIKGLGFNYNRQESDMNFAGPAQIRDMLDRFQFRHSEILAGKGKPLTDTIKDMNQGKVLWKLFIILALIFLGLEIVLLRFWNFGR